MLAPVRFETLRPLELSALWRWQERFYARQGPQAWTSGTVPWRVTSTPLLAEAFADVLAAYAADTLDLGLRRDGQPLCVVDLGAGTGRLAWLLARALRQRGVPFVYVLTDLAAANVVAWRKHPQLMALAAEGLVDFAVADAARPGPLALVSRAEVWTPGALPGPLVAIATYLFDTLPAALWRVRDGVLEAGRVSLEGRGDLLGPEPPPLERVEWTFSFVRPATPPPPFVQAWAAPLGSGTFLVPVGAFRCLRALGALGGGRFLALVADKGPRTRAQVLEQGFPGLARHGCVSASVNFHALRAFWGWRTWFEPRTPSRDLGVYALGQGPSAGRLGRTRTAFEAALGDNQPLASLAAVDRVVGQGDAAAPEALLGALVDSRFSPDALIRLAPQLRSAAPAFPSALVPALVDALVAVWEHHFELGEEADVAFELATILHRAGQLSAADRFYAHSLELRGEHPTTCFNRALVRLDLGDHAMARALLQRTLSLAPAHERARELLGLLGPG